MIPLSRIEDIAFVRFAAPDLGEMRRFLVEFGLGVREEGGRLYGTGRDGAPVVHATEPGEPAFRAFGLRAADIEDLRRVAAHDGVAVEPLDAPGDGFVARLPTPTASLEPGDLLFTGTPAGVGAAMEPRQFLRPGDAVRCEIDRLGAIEAVMVAEA